MSLSHRILLELPEAQCSLEDISEAEWQVFLARLGLLRQPPTIDRWQTLSLLLLLGLRVQRLEHWIDGEDRFLLLPTFASMPLTCQVLAREGRWNTLNCCQDCHGGQGGLIEHVLEDHRISYICCAASFYLDNCSACKKGEI